MKKIISMLLISGVLVSCKKQVSIDTSTEVYINTTKITNPTTGVTTYVTIPYAENLIISTSMQTLESIDITIEDPNQVGNAKAVFPNKWVRQRVSSNEKISFPGGLSFLPNGRNYIFHIVFTGSGTIIQIDTTIKR